VILPVIFFINSMAISFADKRVENWFLMQGYTPTLVLTLTYLLAVKLGMELMKTREAFKFKYILFLYNMGLVVLNLHICYEVSVKEVWFLMSVSAYGYRTEVTV
jgi:hypothetical protein